MKKFVSCLGIVALLYACNKTPVKQDAVTEPPVAEEPVAESDVAGSYIYEQNGDTVNLHLTVNGETAAGHLTYALKEKDRNTGTFEGKIQNGVLLADYTFNSEGRSSVREVAFRLDGTSAVEGYGDVEEKNGKTVFKDASGLEFGKGLVLTKQ